MAKKINSVGHNGRQIRKRSNMIDKLQKELNKKNNQLQCECLHTDDRGKPNVRVVSKDQGGEVILECRDCKKQIYANQVPEKTLMSSARIMENVTDIVKMKLNPSKKSDMKCADWLAEYQYHTKYHITQLYVAAQREKDQYPQVLPSIYGKREIRRKRK